MCCYCFWRFAPPSALRRTLFLPMLAMCVNAVCWRVLYGMSVHSLSFLRLNVLSVPISSDVVFLFNTAHLFNYSETFIIDILCNVNIWCVSYLCESKTSAIQKMSRHRAFLCYFMHIYFEFARRHLSSHHHYSHHPPYHPLILRFYPLVCQYIHNS